MLKLSFTIFSALVFALPAFSQAPSLLTPIDKVDPAAHAWAQAERARNAAITRSSFVEVHVRELMSLRSSKIEKLTMGLSLPGKFWLVEFERSQPSLKHEIFEGRIAGIESQVMLAIDPAGVTAGSLQIEDETYALGYSGIGKTHVLQTLDQTRYKPCATDHRHAVDAGPESETPNPPNQGPAASAVSILDVCVFYTPRAKSTGGGKAAIESQLALRIANAAKSCNTSGVQARFRLVYLAETNYTENGSTGDLSRFRNTNDGYMDEVHAARNTYGGDLMALITQPPSLSYCGVAYLMTRLSTGFRSSAFGVTVRSCLGGNTLTHEIGHNIGCHHDKNNAGNAIYPYAYGYRTPDSRYRTIMSYAPGTRTPLWSGPNVKYSNYTMGTATDDNVRTINNTRATVAQFKPTKTYRWVQIKGGIAGQNGMPTITGQGTINKTVPIRVSIAKTRNAAPGALVIGAMRQNLPLLGGMLIPSPNIAASITGNGGKLNFNLSAMAGVKAGSKIWFQAWFLDKAAAQGASASPGMVTTTL